MKSKQLKARKDSGFLKKQASQSICQEYIILNSLFTKLEMKIATEAMQHD